MYKEESGLIIIKKLFVREELDLTKKRHIGRIRSDGKTINAQKGFGPKAKQ